MYLLSSLRVIKIFLKSTMHFIGKNWRAQLRAVKKQQPKISILKTGLKYIVRVPSMALYFFSRSEHTKNVEHFLRNNDIFNSTLHTWHSCLQIFKLFMFVELFCRTYFHLYFYNHRWSAIVVEVESLRDHNKMHWVTFKH